MIILSILLTKGTSKSIYLMISHLENSRDYKFPLLYINYRKLIELDSKGRKNNNKKRKFIHNFPRK